MQFSVNFVGDMARLAGLDASARQAVTKGLTGAALDIEARWKLNVMAVLNRQPTGQLANSIHTDVDPGGLSAVVSTDKVYARIHELGGTIVPTAARVLHWVGPDGMSHFARSVTIPARPTLAPAVEAAGPAIRRKLLDPFKGLLG